MVNGSRIITAARVQVLDHSNSNRAKIQAVLDKIGDHKHPAVQEVLATLQDYLNGAPARYLALAYDPSSKIIGAMTFIDASSEQTITSLGAINGDATKKSLIRALNHTKTLVVNALEPSHSFFNSIGFRHSNELEPGEPSEMLKLPPGHEASRDKQDGRMDTRMRLIMASRILTKPAIPYYTLGDIISNALSYRMTETRLQKLKEGKVQPATPNEVTNLEHRLSFLSTKDINTPGRENLRDELLSVVPSFTKGQLKGLVRGVTRFFFNAGKKTLPLLSEDLIQSLSLLRGTHSASTRKIATELSQCYCTNEDCADFDKRGHGNLTQEFSYGVDSDRHMLYCTTCQKRFSETKCTEFFNAKLNSEDIADILDKAADHMSIRDIAEALNLNKDTVNNVLLKAKDICEDYVNKDKSSISTDMLSDMDLEKKHKPSLKDFISEVLLPELNGSDEKKEPQKKEAHKRLLH